MKKAILICICLIIVLGIGYWIRNQEISPSQNSSLIIYTTQDECENETGETCVFNYGCDYIPNGRTVEEVCGKNTVGKGWVGPSEM